MVSDIGHAAAGEDERVVGRRVELDVEDPPEVVERVAHRAMDLRRELPRRADRLALDFTKIALAELGSISERRTALLVDPRLNGGLPPFLAASSGIDSGMMIYQYTAAALVSENKVLAHPASVDSIPTSANQEDHVSMGSISARHARTVARARRADPRDRAARRGAGARAAARRRGGAAPGDGVAEALAAPGDGSAISMATASRGRTSRRRPPWSTTAALADLAG